MASALDASVWLMNFDELKDRVIEGEKMRDNPQCVPDFVASLWIEDHADGGLRAALQHVLPFFVEAGSDRVVILERYE